MNNFRVPPSPAWYTPPVCSPENGLLYISGNHTSIAYIPPNEKDNTASQKSNDTVQDIPNIQIIQTHNQYKSIVCDPNWTSTKWFVTMNEQNMIWVWDLATEKICKGHKAHVKNGNGQNDTDSQLGGTMCITKNRQVLSIDRNALVRYCLVSNTYSFFPDNFILKRGTVSLLKTSPYNEDMVAVGYRNGLIIIADYADATVLQKLRGHDSEIVSLQWTKIKPSSDKEIKCNFPSIPDAVAKASKAVPSPSKPKFDKTSEKKQTRREAPKPIVDAGDMFDIHSYDYLEEEFGTISYANRETQNDFIKNNKPNPTNENFNFVEECQTLREQISAGNQSDSDGDQTAVNMSDIRNMMKAKAAVVDDSIELSDDSDNSAGIDDFSNRSTIGSSHNTTEIAELEDVIKDLNSDEAKMNGVVYLASGAQEAFVVIWNPETGSICDKIPLRSQGRTKIPKPNCTIAWVSPDKFIVNGPDGKISTWKAQCGENSDNLKFISVATEYTDAAVIDICSNVDYGRSKPIVYTSSTHLNIIGHRFIDESSEVIAKYSTLPIGMLVLRECPHDPNKIAIAGNNKRINILDLSTLKEDNVDIQSLTSKIQGKVIALAWHPINENLLCFSTNEGRVGVFNISKASSAPDLMKHFNGKGLYSLSYSVDTDSKQCTLYATNGNNLMMFNENSTKNGDHKSLEFPMALSSACANDKYIAIGFANGTLKILLNDESKKEVFSETLSKKYLSELSWSSVNQTKLAVSTSTNSIFILEDGDDGFKKTGELIGHQNVVSFVSWSSKSEHKLVSASFDHTVRIWDTQTMECVAWTEYENKMHCAAFLPTDENFIICSGLSETLHIFEIQKRLVSDIGPFDTKKKKKTTNNDATVQWGTLYQNEASKLRSQEKKKLRRMEKKVAENVDEITNDLNAVKITPAPVKLNHTTILYLTSKELNKEPLDHLQRLLESPDTNADSGSGDVERSANECLHAKLFGTREDVVQLLNDELKNHKGSKTESIGHLLIPQMNFELKANIIESIEEKRLTEQQISLAPSISYEFWKNCTLAYANQCIEQGLVLKAIPHLLVISQINEAIDKLCDAHFHREAWCIAKMYKQPEDKIFETIVNNWIKHLEHMGNLEGASLIAFLVDKLDISHEILSKRKNKTPQVDEILNVLSQKISN